MVKLRQLSLLIILAFLTLLAACSGEPDTPEPTAVATRSVAAEATATNVPTSTDEPAPAETAPSAPAEATPAAGSWYTDIDPAFDFAPCEPDGQFPDVSALSEEEIAELEESGEGFLPPDEVIFTGLEPLVGAEAHAYRTVYAYQDDDGFAEGQLALDIRGQHAGIPLDPTAYYSPTVSGFFSTNHYLVTDLESGRVREFVSGEDGVWLREDSAGWTQFSPALAPTMGAGYYALAPLNVGLMASGAGSLSPGVRSAVPLMALDETIGGQEVIHYCWVPGDADFGDGQIYPAFAYLVHYESVYTFLQHAELHVWVSAEDESLQRIVITGEHTGDRFFNSFVEHEPAQEFFVWSEVLPADAAPLPEPDAGDVELTFAASDEAEAEANQPLPLPPDAEPTDPDRLDTVLEVEASDIDENPYPFAPRELVINEQEALFDVLDTLDLNMNAADFGVYETSMSTAELLAYYAEAMPAAGWALDSAALVTGRTAVVLHYAGADDAGALLILREGEPGRSLIYTLEPQIFAVASAPPTPTPNPLDALEAVEGEWQRFDATNSPLGAIEVMSIDDQGRVWVFSDAELHVYDVAADAWSTHSLPENRPEDWTPDAVGAHGEEVLISFFDGFYYFDGATWERPLEGFFFNLGFLPDGTPWADGGNYPDMEGLWLYDGSAWNRDEAARACAGTSSFLTIRSDAEGRFWASRPSSIGDFDPGVWLIDGEECRLILTGFEFVDAIVPTAQGSVWISELETGIVELNDQGEIVRELEGAPGLFDLKPVAVGPDGSLWLTAEQGFFRVTPEGAWVSYDLPGDVGYFGPNAVLFDQAGRLWVVEDDWVAYLPAEG